MNQPGQETPISSHRIDRVSASNVGSALALAVSVFALAIGAYQTRLMQGQARASVWPFLSIGYTYSSNTDANGFIWTIVNNGVGPAKVESVTLSLDGKPMKRWDDVLAALGAPQDSNSAMSSISGEVIPPDTNRETTIPAIKINSREAASLFKQAEARFRMDICYCSVYDECWIAHWQKARVDPVGQCDTTGTVQFEQ
ncbi:hypothetical protein [Dokdonella soli]|uniref:Uncharacterized protein n=1 Tax=Dokdonella soli TaxID=529810 RepID=A0ABP3TJ34_9GAMM